MFRLAVTTCAAVGLASVTIGGCQLIAGITGDDG